MAYAIIETGGKQYRVEPGDTITVEKLSSAEGSAIEFDRVLFVSGDDGVKVGRPTVKDVRVVAEIATQGRADKITVFKYKPKTRYRVKTGHRQSVTRVAIKEIVAVAPTRQGRQAAAVKAKETRNPGTRVRRPSSGA